MISVPDKKESEWIEAGVDEFGMPVWIEDITWVSQPDEPTRDQITHFIEPDLEMQALFDQAYVRIPDEDGNLPPRAWVMPGRSADHLGV